MNLKKAAPAAALLALAVAAVAAQTRPTTNRPPTVKLAAASSRVVRAVDCGASPACTPTASTVHLSAEAADPDGDRLSYAHSATGGRVTGDGPEAALDLTGAAPGIYKITLKVEDGRGGAASDTAAITLEHCGCSQPIPRPPCPSVTVSCPDGPSSPGSPVSFTANVTGGDPDVTPTFKWEVSAGLIGGGQGTSSITVDTTGLPASSALTATVDIGGYDRECSTSSSCTMTPVCVLSVARKLDEYGAIVPGEENDRLRNFAIELRNEPTAEGHIICYGGRNGGGGVAARGSSHASASSLVHRSWCISWAVLRRRRRSGKVA